MAVMPLTDSTVFAKAEYWDEYYTKSGHGEEPLHEWLRSFAQLEEFLRPALFDIPSLSGQDNPLILHLGSGDSVRKSINFQAPCSPEPPLATQS